ncbi:hypothetical protein B0H13DRAFT_2099952 [Mycena leptocephala]|nr:hypothetical protein B0H13DRAFT_2099952 [Mycena leptocephala]
MRHIPRRCRTGHKRRSSGRCTRHVRHNVADCFAVQRMVSYNPNLSALFQSNPRTKPIIFRTVLVRWTNNWTQRITDLLLPNAHFIRTLALDLPLARGSLSDSDLAHLRRLVEAAHSVQHLALFLPEDIARANNLAYVAYAADRTPLPTIGALCEDEDLSALRGAMFVLVDVAEEYSGDEDADELVKDDLAVYARFSTAYVRFASGVLGEWVAKMEGRPSVLVHPPPHVVESVEEED